METDRRWWSIPAVTLLVAVLTVGGQFWNSRSETDAKLLDIGIRVLQAEPREETKNLREWAIELVNKHSDVQLSGRAQQELRLAPLPNGSFSSWYEALNKCELWRRNADGSWTQPGKIQLPGGNVFENNTFGPNTVEARRLEALCGQKH